MHKCSRLWLEVFNSWPELWWPPAWSGVVGHRHPHFWVSWTWLFWPLTSRQQSGFGCSLWLTFQCWFLWACQATLFSLHLFHFTGICLSHSDRCFRFIKRASMTRSLVTLCGLMCWTKIGIFHEWSKNQFQCVQVDRFLFWSWTWKFLDVNGKWTLFFKAMKIEHFVLLKNRQKTLGTFGQFYVWRIQKLFYL